ncbi:MAG: hypothetical protein M3463_01995 [Verrucomicrobiota bacterium]|nr:hypothetical protein [Verrucomicrobiota bacterium]
MCSFFAGNGSDLDEDDEGSLTVTLHQDGLAKTVRSTFVKHSDTEHLARSMAAALEENGFSTVVMPHDTLGNRWVGEWIVVVNPGGGPVAFADEISSNDSAIFIDATNWSDPEDTRDRYLDYTFSYGALDLHALALNFGDRDPATIDIFAIPDKHTVQPLGRRGALAFNNTWTGILPSETMPGLQNMFFMQEQYADLTRFPGAAYVAGHETAHVLLQHGPWDVLHFDRDHSNITPSSTRWLSGDHVRSPRRMTERLLELPEGTIPNQHGWARFASGPDANPAILRFEPLQ